MNKKIAGLITSVIVVILMIVGIIVHYNNTGELDTKKIEETINTAIEGIQTYNMTEEEVKELPTTTIEEKTTADEKVAGDEQATTETEGFEEQGEIAYNGTSEYPSITLGNYQGLTYYSQIDNRWSSHPYTSTGNLSQTIGSSGCGPTSASMVVTATKGTILPPDMGDLFVRYGYRSANNGTYYSAFRWVADTFDIEYNETYNTDTAINLLRNNNYVVVACGNGLFTTGGHFIVLTGIDGDTISVYDPYLYAGKFDTSTRRGKVSVNGNIAYVSVSNFKNYANPKKFFAYKHNGNVPTNNTKPVITNGYTRYVRVNSSLRVRKSPNGAIIGRLKNGTAVTVYEISGSWSRIGDNRWVSSNYLVSNTISSGSNYTNSKKKYTTGKYRVTAGLLNVRTGAGTKYKAKKYNQLTANARSQNSRLGNSRANGLKRGVITTVSRVSGLWGLTPSGWICLQYCIKL